MNQERLLEAGAILLPESKLSADILSDDVVARQWAHPALDSPIVQLPTANMLRGVDLEMSLLGFEEPIDRGTVGKQRRKKLGFPGWALVNDPDNARFALDVVKSLKKAVRKLKSKPGAAKEEIDGIAAGLATTVPHFLPSFYEETAQHFINFENYTYAAQYFEKAREAERVYALEVDPELREQTFVDFALARALSIKSLTNFGREMIDAGTPEEGYHAYFRIAVRRTRGGLPPSPAMAKDLKRLAKAAGLDPKAEEGRFLKELFGAPALRMAAAGFWKAYRTSLIQLAKDDPSARAELLDLFPSMHPRSWFEVLDACDATRALYDDSVDPAVKSKHTTADWFGKIIAQQNSAGWRARYDIAEGIFTLFEKCSERLKSDGIPIPVASGWQALNPDVAEAGLAAGATFALSEGTRFVRLYSMTDYIDSPHRCLDWTHIVQDPAMRALALESVDDSSYYTEDWVQLLDERPALKSVAEEWLTKEIDRTSESGTVVSSFHALNRVATFSKDLWRHFPELANKLAATNVAVPLQNSLQIGIPDELKWQAWDEICAKFPERSSLQASDCFPYLVVWDKSVARVLGPNGIELEHELAIPKDYELSDMIFTQGTLLFTLRKNWDDYGMWLGSSKVFELEHGFRYRGECVVAPDGRAVIDGYRVVTPGEEKFEYSYERQGKLFTDGTRYWKRTYPDRMTEVDPITGKKSGDSKPPFFEDWDPGQMRVIPNANAKSPIPLKGDVLMTRTKYDEERRVYAFEDGSGNKVELSQSVESLFRFPGRDEFLAWRSSYRSFELRTINGDQVVTDDRRFRKGGAPNISPFYLAYAEPRSDADSKTLRQVSLEVCERLIADAIDDDENGTKARAAVDTHLSEIGDATIRDGIGGFVQLVVEQQTMLNKIKAAVEGGGPAPTVTKEPAVCSEALDGLVRFYRVYGRNPAHVLTAPMRAFCDHLNNTDRTAGAIETADPTAQWESLVGHSAALMWRTLLPVSDEVEELAGFKAYLDSIADIMAESPLVGDGLENRVRLFETELPVDAEDDPIMDHAPYRFGQSHGSSVSSYDGSDWWSMMDEDEVSGIEFVTTGTFRSNTVAGQPGPGWGTVEQLAELRVLRENNGPIPVREILESFGERTGLSTQEAGHAVTWWGRDLFGIVKSSEDWVYDVVRNGAVGQRQFFSEIIVAGPLSELWEPDALLERVLTVWGRYFPKFAPLAPADVNLCRKQLGEVNTTFLRGAGSPEFDIWPGRDGHNLVTLSYWGGVIEGFESLNAWVETVDFALRFARVGTPLYDGIAPTWTKVRERIASNRELFSLGSTWELEDPQIKALLSEFSERVPDVGENIDFRHNNGVYVSLLSYRADFFSTWGAIDRSEPLVDRIAIHMSGSVDVLQTVMGGVVDSVIERVKTTPVPEGEFECNPKYSAPDVVADVCETYGISEHAASLYLQLATLPYPSNANVRLWNGWTKKPHDQAIAELVEKNLVTSAKRSRAGRAEFIGGPWAPKEWRFPIESWKYRHLGWLTHEGEYGYDRPFGNCVLVPPHILFERCWQRHKEGDVPGFESPAKR